MVGSNKHHFYDILVGFLMECELDLESLIKRDLMCYGCNLIIYYGIVNIFALPMWLKRDAFTMFLLWILHWDNDHEKSLFSLLDGNIIMFSNNRENQKHNVLLGPFPKFDFRNSFCRRGVMLRKGGAWCNGFYVVIRMSRVEVTEIISLLAGAKLYTSNHPQSPQWLEPCTLGCHIF